MGQTRSGRHALYISDLNNAFISHAFLMGQFPFQNDADNFHFFLGMGGGPVSGATTSSLKTLRAPCCMKPVQSVKEKKRKIELIQQRHRWKMGEKL
jgi:hypothetical protein